MKNIPASLRRYANKIQEVEDARADRNGWWVYLRPGWIYDGTHQIHEDTLTACAIRLRSADPCVCEDCQQALLRANQSQSTEAE